MGQEATCTATFGRQSSKGRALLETDYLLFRGDFRLRIPFRDMKSVEADKEDLHIRFSAGVLALRLGAAAGKWAQKILHPPSRLDKLGVKPASRVCLIGVRDKQFQAELERRAKSVTTRLSTGADFVFFAAETAAGLARLPALRKSLAPDGAIWVLYPKGVKSITQADVMAASKSASLVDIKVASFSETHTALKLVIPRSARPTHG